MKAKTRRRLRKAKVNRRFSKGVLKASVTHWGDPYWINRKGRHLSRKGFFIHTLNLLENLGVKIDMLCGPAWRRNKYKQNQMLKALSSN